MSISDRLDEIEDDIHNAFRLPKTPAVALVAEEWAPDMLAALRAVLDLHRAVEVEPSDTICAECSWQLPNGRYFGKVEEWPCPTVLAVQAALGEVQQ